LPTTSSPPTSSATTELDINIVRALLYMQRRDPRIDQRVRQYLHRPPAPRSHLKPSCALDPNEGEDRAFEIIAAIGALDVDGRPGRARVLHRPGRGSALLR
jgi:hypothetical protein